MSALQNEDMRASTLRCTHASRATASVARLEGVFCWSTACCSSSAACAACARHEAM